MGLRRTPPPGMAAPPPPPENYMTEYPEEQVHVQVEATPTATPAQEEASAPPPASAPESSQQQPYTTSQVHRSSSQITGTPVSGGAGSADAATASANTPLAIASSGGWSARSAQGTPTPAPPNKPVRRSPVARSAPAPATPTPPPPREPDAAAAAAPAAPPPTTTTTTTTTPPPQATPQRNLLTLAAGLNRAPAPTTPHHHPPPRPHPSARRTPGAHRLAPKLTARSPHAIRAFTRRAATPARRRSMRYAAPARESPRDWLLKLSGILAPTTAPFVPTPVQTPRVREEEMLYFSDPGEDGEEEEERPRTEVNFYDDGEEGWEVLVRPEARSVERGRRAVSEQPWAGGRASFGITWDDRFADLDALREQAGEGETTQVADVSMGLGDVTVGGISVGEESLGRVARMGFVPEEEEEDEEDAEGDVTMGMERGEELPFDEGDSYFFPMPAEGSPAPPAPAHDSDTDSDTGLPLDYSVPSPDADLDSDNDAAPTAAAALKTQKPERKQHPLSRHGHPLPPFPRATIKKMAQTFLGGGASIGGEALEALVRASDAFWEQAAGDLAAYAGHAGRRTIEEGDVVVLMGRQRVITEGATLFSLAQRHLPRELLQQVRMPVVKSARGKGKGKGKGKGAAKGKGKAVEGEVEGEVGGAEEGETEEGAET